MTKSHGCKGRDPSRVAAKASSNTSVLSDQEVDFGYEFDEDATEIEDEATTDIEDEPVTKKSKSMPNRSPPVFEHKQTARKSHGHPSSAAKSRSPGKTDRNAGSGSFVRESTNARKSCSRPQSDQYDHSTSKSNLSNSPKKVQGPKKPSTSALSKNDQAEEDAEPDLDANYEDGMPMLIPYDFDSFEDYNKYNHGLM